MKNRKWILVVSLVMSLAMSLSGTLAYLTATDSDVNVMTLGNVEIKQLENGEDGPIDLEVLYPAYIDPQTQEINGLVEKEVTVENTGSSDAFVRTVIAFEAGKITTKADFDKVIVPAFGGEVEWVEGPVEINGENYFVATYTYDKALLKGETTEPSLLSVYMAPSAGNADVEQFGAEYKILVVSQAVQTTNLEELGAEKALVEAFGEITADKNPWLGENAVGTEGEKADLVITNVSELKAFAQAVNSGDDFSGKTVALSVDIDLGGAEWEPIGNGASISRAANAKTAVFKGTFDGNDHVISNFTVTDKVAAGLFGRSQGLIKDLTVKNATVNSNHYAGGIVGYGMCAKIEDCHVVDSKITSAAELKADGSGYDNGDKVGGIVGYLSAEPTAYVKNCSVTGTTITGYRDLGGVVGYANRACDISNCTISGNTIIQDMTHNYKTIEKGERVGEIVGMTGAYTDKNGNVLEPSIDNNEAAGDNVVTAPVPVASQSDLEAALTAGDDVKVAAGSYTFPSGKITADTTIICEEGTKFTGGASLDIKGATVIGATFENNGGTAATGTVNGTYKDCDFSGSNGLRWCYAGENAVFENCVFSGSVYGAHFDGGANSLTFKNCTFSGFNAFGSAITKLTLDGCTFVANGKSGYNGVNLWGSTDLIDCTFVFDGTVNYEWVDACGDGKTYSFTDCVVTDGTSEKGIETIVGDYGEGNTITIDGNKYDPNQNMTRQNRNMIEEPSV